jgi:hypothetical protein
MKTPSTKFQEPQNPACARRKTERALENSRLVANVSDMIVVKHSAGDEWVVSVQDAVATHHRVPVTEADLQRLSEGQSAERLLEESFRFLLEREPNTSILGSFDLPLIGRYFPEYEREIRNRLRRNA